MQSFSKLVFLVSFLSLSAQAQESRMSDYNQELRSVDFFGYKPMIHLSSGLFHHGATQQKGTPIDFKILGTNSIMSNYYILDIGVGAHSMFLTQYEKKRNVFALSTEVAVRKSLPSNWQIGPEWNMLMGAGDSYGSFSDSFTHFFGFGVYKEFQDVNSYRIRVGGSANLGVSVKGNDAWNVLAHVQVGFSDKRPFVSEPVVVENEIEEVIVENHISAQANQLTQKDIGPKKILYGLGRVSTQDKDAAYLKRLAMALKMNEGLVSTIDMRGLATTEDAKSMSTKVAQWRAQDAATILKQSGLPPSMISFSGKTVEQEKGTRQIVTPNRRVEITFIGVSNADLFEKMLKDIE